MNEDDRRDVEFLTKIISMICNYSVENNMNPDDSIRIIAKNLLELSDICTFANWKIDDECEIFEF